MSTAVFRRSSRVGEAPRLLLAAAIATLAGLLVAGEADTRAAEAQLARLLVGTIASGRAVASGPVVYFGIGTPQVTGLSITTMCSTTVLIVPLLLLAVAVIGITRARLSRVGMGLAVGVTLAVTCNMIRFASAAWAYSAYGRDGFDLVHRYVGSLFVIAGFITAILLLLRISLRESRDRRAAATPRSEAKVPRHRQIEASARGQRGSGPGLSGESSAPLRRDRRRSATRPRRGDLR